MVDKRFQKQALLNKLDSVSWSLREWITVLALQAEASPDEEDQIELRAKVGELDAMLSDIASLRADIRAFEPR